MLVADHDGARKAIRRLAEGIWTSGIVERGYGAAVRDVQQSARLTSNTLPIMVMADYGNPRYVERCMEVLERD